MKVWMYGGRWDRGERDAECEHGDGSDGGNGRVVEIRTIGQLLPMSFGREDLERGGKPL